jgi:ferritin-like metal-binding protein YciE
VNLGNQKGKLKMKTLHDAFEHTLHDIYFAENAIAKALPKVIGEVENPGLRTALQNHLKETKQQIKVLDAEHQEESQRGKM